MRRVQGFFRFWYDFVVGEDWRVAFGVTASLGLTAGLHHRSGATAWWILPIAVGLLMCTSVFRVARRSHRR